MKKSYKNQLIGGTVFVGLLGSFLHFLYDLTNRSILAVPFSAINESTWEHMKLLFISMLALALIENRLFSQKKENFWSSKLFGIIFGLILIPVFYYTYTGTLGVFADWFNIAIFFISAATGLFLEKKLLENDFNPFPSEKIPFLILISGTVIFTILSFIPLDIPLFREP